ncbi:ABC transporter ATP-binding protein [Atopobacter sp. AH10]|uniref:ABC transporter ATP-binding protein n=1 Tax=Atopobacter sp. AH10 TaxID=2315861 RepID=UPI000EF1E5C6|nr:ABC transporter ATP-binding protein [Atopobacter sp. AH10]RLK63124.1 ABC transporter ATP-binding protein [Atopobacter sp. AH10]
MIHLTNINKFYQTGETSLQVLQDINLRIESGEFVTVMGPSGSGKSTLINVLGFLDRKFEGAYVFDNELVKAKTDDALAKIRNKTVGFVFQDFNLINTLNVADNVRVPLLYAGMLPSQTHDRVKEVLTRVGLADRMDHYPNQLSGGQKQRVAIARAIVNRPRFIIADEPTGALDSKTSAKIMDLLRELNEEDQVTIIMVTHDPSLERFATHSIKIKDGQVLKDEVLG